MSSLAFTAGAWLWEKYGETVTNKAAGAVKEKWNKFKWRSAAEAYRAKIKKLYGTMQIMGMAEPVSLDDIFTDAYMLDKPTAFHRFDIKRLKQLSADPDAPPPNAERINGLRLVVEKESRLVKESEGKSKSILEQVKGVFAGAGEFLSIINPKVDESFSVIEQARNLFILGKPGAGKTTFLKYIALKAAEQIVDKVPIFVSLKHWADSGLELMPFIAERFEICDFPDAQPFVEELLKSGNAIVLFDGLDEVNQESGQRDKQTRAMNNFVEKYDRTQCLVTCRIAASNYSFHPFTYVEIADFTKKQVQTFVSNWFRREGEKDEDTCKKFFVEFARDDNKGLRELARTPLLLTLLCLSFNETLTFPQRRVEIYEEALDALLKKWDASKRLKRDEVYRKLSLGHKENMLAHVAAETFERNEYFIPQPELERFIANYVRNIPPHDTNDVIDAEAILKAIEVQHGIFVERARKVYSFSHMTFQEYFTAKYIISDATKAALTNLVRKHGTDERWHEVFLLTVSLLPDATQFMNAFRRSVDEFLDRDETLGALLAWADKRSASINLDPPVVRPYYLYIGLYYQKLADARESASRYGMFTDAAGGVPMDFNSDLLSNIYSDINRALDSPLAHTLVRAFTFALSRRLTRELGLDSVRGMSTLSTPSDKTAAAEWKKFARELRSSVIKRHRDTWSGWDLSGAQEARLTDYLNATRLLKDCLELATMPPDEKKVMLSNLYLTPARADKGQDA